MNTLKQLLFAVAVTICFSMTATAQKEPDKKPPPKEGEPPIVVVQPKPTPDKPKDDRKKPNAAMMYIREENY